MSTQLPHPGHTTSRLVPLSWPIGFPFATRNRQVELGRLEALREVITNFGIVVDRRAGLVKLPVWINKLIISNLILKAFQYLDNIHPWGGGVSPNAPTLYWKLNWGHSKILSGLCPTFRSMISVISAASVDWTRDHTFPPATMSALLFCPFDW